MAARRSDVASCTQYSPGGPPRAFNPAPQLTTGGPVLFGLTDRPADLCGVETRPPARPSAGGDLAQPGGSASLGPASVASKTDHAESVLSEKYFSACLIPASIVSLVS